MTDLDWTTPPDDATRPEREPAKCRRHDWGNEVTDHDFSHDPFGPCLPSCRFEEVCRRCGKVRDEAVARRNRRNRQRGGAFERSVAKKLGGRKTGPLGGRDDVMVGELFAIQTKRAQRFGLTEARQYLGDLRRTYPTRTPLVVHALPGERGGVVILTLEDWVSLHGGDGQGEGA